MTAVLLIGLFALGAIYSTIIKEQNRSSRQKYRERQYQRKQVEIQFDYNRFNTKGERSSQWQIEGELIYFETDIQTLQIAEQRLFVRVSSELDGATFKFAFLVGPFDLQLFEINDFQNFNQTGIIVLFPVGDLTAIAFEAIPELEVLAAEVCEARKAKYLNVSHYQVDGPEKSVIINGSFADGLPYKLTLDYHNYRLQIEASLSSILNAQNFTPANQVELVA